VGWVGVVVFLPIIKSLPTYVEIKLGCGILSQKQKHPEVLGVSGCGEDLENETKM
jgi:hypothetical protein